MKRLHMLAVVVLALVLVAVSACGDDTTETTAPSTTGGSTTTGGVTTTGGPTTTAPLSGRQATVVLGKDFTVDLGMDPARAYEELDFLVLGNCYSRLVKFGYRDDGTLNVDQVIGDLAADFSVSDDAKALTFTLRDDAVFTSGSPVTSEDVRWSYMRLMNVKGVPSFLMANVASIDTPDAQTVVINLTVPDLGFIKLLTAANFAVVDSAVVKANGGSAEADADQTDTAEEFLSTQSYGSGPFQMTSYDRGEQLTLERWDGYWGESKPAIEKFIVRNIPQPEVQVSSLERGDIDLTWSLGAQPELVASLEGQGFQIDVAPTLEWYMLMFTADPANNDAVANEKIQQALKLATDWEGLASICSVGSTRMSTAPEGFGGPAPATLPGEDLEAARALLADAGYPDGFQMRIQGFRYPSCPTYENMAVKLQQDWARIGVEVELNFQDFDAAIGPIRAGEFQAAFTGWIADYPDKYNYTTYFLPGTILANRARWGDTEERTVDRERFPSFDRIVELGETMRTSIDPAEVEAAYAELAPLLLDAGALLPVFQIDVVYGVAKDLTGFNYHVLYKWDLARLGRSTG